MIGSEASKMGKNVRFFVYVRGYLPLKLIVSVVLVPAPNNGWKNANANANAILEKKRKYSS
jgi:hypothetical protein